LTDSKQFVDQGVGALGAISRRGFLARLAGIAAITSLPIHKGHRWPKRVGGNDEGILLDESESRIASLGGHLQAKDPELAFQLMAEAESEMPAWSSIASRRRRAGLVQDRLLDPSRRNADLDREQIVLIDGWVLARSEAAAAVYMNALG
jgi:hypothetical protein